jgi:hypothetical protein
MFATLQALIEEFPELMPMKDGFDCITFLHTHQRYTFQAICNRSYDSFRYYDRLFVMPDCRRLISGAIPSDLSTVDIS